MLVLGQHRQQLVGETDACLLGVELRSDVHRPVDHTHGRQNGRSGLFERIAAFPRLLGVVGVLSEGEPVKLSCHQSSPA